MKKILFAILISVSIPFGSCTSDALDRSNTTNHLNYIANPIPVSQKNEDSIGGQRGQIPPPPPVNP